jgi:hypothetical protein
MSKEHIPAKGAFKRLPYRVRVLAGEKALEREGGNIYQRGFHANVLCGDLQQQDGGLVRRGICFLV